jgi:predicted nuclease of restriction endonuclease-like (RecB) superfamily
MVRRPRVQDVSDEVRVPGLSADYVSSDIDAPDATAETTYASIHETLAAARGQVATVVNTAMVQAYWDIGRRIVEAQGERADYGKRLLHYLAQRLTAEFGPGFDESNLRNMRRFYSAFPIQETLSPELSWSHYNVLAKVPDPAHRDFYAREAAESGWTVRQLRRQISTLFYERILASRKDRRDEVSTEITKREPRTGADDLLKDPYVFEFLDVAAPRRYLERDLEQGLIDKLQDFLLELGKGFSFVARQKRVSSDTKHYFIDLVFYNYLLKCFVLVDLKVGELSHEDVGQMDFYRRIFDDKIRPEGDNPSIGIILCSGKDEAIAKYSVLADNVGLYASAYKTYLPSEDELRQELQSERDLLEVQRSAPEDT